MFEARINSAKIQGSPEAVASVLNLLDPTCGSHLNLTAQGEAKATIFGDPETVSFDENRCFIEVGPKRD